MAVLYYILKIDVATEILYNITRKYLSLHEVQFFTLFIHQCALLF